jgi:di/tricarboxylate transporter
MRAAAVIVFTIGFFATGVIPEPVTALGFFLFSVLLGVAAPAKVFSGFASGALWLVIGGMAIGIAVTETGLGERMARGLFARFTGSYSRVIAAVIGVTFILGFFIPSGIARIVLLFPVVTSLADQVGLAPGSRGRTGMVLALGMTIFNPLVAVLPSVVPNVILAGAAETIYGLGFKYGSWLILHLPVIGILKAVVIHLAVVLLFPDRAHALAPQAERSPWSPEERRLAVVLAATLLLWMTDALHGVSPAWVALASGFVCLLPRIGFAPPQAFNRQIPLGIVLYVAATLGMGAVIVDTGLGKLMGGVLLEWMDLAPGESARSFAALVGLSTVTTVVVTVGATPPVLAPLAGDLAAASGMGVMPVLMAMVVGYTVIFLPYQAPPLMLTIQMAGVSVGMATRVTLAVAVAAIFVLIPLNYLWWLALGFWP